MVADPIKLIPVETCAFRRRQAFTELAIEHQKSKPLAFLQISNVLRKRDGKRRAGCNRPVTILNQNRSGWHVTSLSGAGLRQGFSIVICVFL